MPVHILQIETSTEICSVAVGRDGATLTTLDVRIPNSHSELITETILQCMVEAGLRLSDLDAVAIGSGPGSYTSLRVGYSTVKGLCYCLDKPLISIPSLQILASGVDNAEQDACIVAMIDARRMDAYVAIYGHDLRLLQDVQALTLDEATFDLYKKSFQTIHLCGSGAPKYMEKFADHPFVMNAVNTSAAFMSQAAFNAFTTGLFEDVAYARPDYLKSPNITQSQKKFF